MIPLNESHVQFLSQMPVPSTDPIYQHPATAALNDPASRFPQPRSTAPIIERERLVQQFMILGDLLNAGTLLVDVRRTDYEGGTIRGSLNLPAQSFPLQMSTLYRLCAGDGLAVISRVVFYCGKSWTVCSKKISNSSHTHYHHHHHHLKRHSLQSLSSDGTTDNHFKAPLRVVAHAVQVGSKTM